MSRPATNRADVPDAATARRTTRRAAGRVLSQTVAPPPTRPRTSRQQQRGASRAALPRRRHRCRWAGGRNSHLRLVQEEDRRRDVCDPPLAIFLEAPLDKQAERPRNRGASMLQSGSAPSTAASVSYTLSFANAAFPVSISNSTQPNAQMSARLSTGLPAPARAHVRRRAEDHARLGHRRRRDGRRPGQFGAPPTGSIAFARPKSSTFTVPSARTLMFAGFRSRWMMPCSCAASSASAICFAIGSASSSGMGPRARRCADRRLRRVPSRGR